MCISECTPFLKYVVTLLISILFIKSISPVGTADSFHGCSDRMTNRKCSCSRSVADVILSGSSSLSYLCLLGFALCHMSPCLHIVLMPFALFIIETRFTYLTTLLLSSVFNNAVSFLSTKSTTNAT